MDVVQSLQGLSDKMCSTLLLIFFIQIIYSASRDTVPDTAESRI